LENQKTWLEVLQSAVAIKVVALVGKHMFSQDEVQEILHKKDRVVRWKQGQKHVDVSCSWNSDFMAEPLLDKKPFGHKVIISVLTQQDRAIGFLRLSGSPERENHLFGVDNQDGEHQRYVFARRNDGFEPIYMIVINKNNSVNIQKLDLPIVGNVVGLEITQIVSKTINAKSEVQITEAIAVLNKIGVEVGQITTLAKAIATLKEIVAGTKEMPKRTPKE
jgi:hypothetical protein